MEFLHARAQEDTIGVFKETEIHTPTSKTEKMAMLIHKVMFEGDDTQCEDPGWHATIIGLWNQSGSLGVGINDPRTMMIWKRFQRKSVNFQEMEMGPRVFDFDPPILYARSSIYLGIRQTNSGAGVAVKTGDVIIGYTLEKVSERDFISALIE